MYDESYVEKKIFLLIISFKYVDSSFDKILPELMVNKKKNIPHI